MPGQCEEVVRRDFHQVYREHFRVVWKHLARLGVAGAQLEDAVQEVFVVAHRRRESQRDDVSATTWLFGITRRVAANYRRTEARHRHKLDALAESGDATRSPDPSARYDAAALLESGLHALDDDHRTTLVLAEFERMTAKEIGALLGIPANTASSRLREARARFREAVGDELAVDAALRAAPTLTEPREERAQRVWLLLAPQLGLTAAGEAESEAGVETPSPIADPASARSGALWGSVPATVVAVAALAVGLGQGEPAKSEVVARAPAPPLRADTPTQEVAPTARGANQPAAPSSTLADQVLALTAVRKQLANERFEAAVQSLASFRARYPESPFAEELGALAASAYAGAGKLGDACAEMRTLHETAPGSPAATRAAQACRALRVARNGN